MKKNIVIALLYISSGSYTLNVCNEDNQNVIELIQSISPTANEISYKMLIEKLAQRGHTPESAVQLLAYTKVQKEKEELEKNLGAPHLFKLIEIHKQKELRPLARIDDMQDKILLSQFDPTFNKHILSCFYALNLGFPDTLILQKSKNEIPNAGAWTHPIDTPSLLKGHMILLELPQKVNPVYLPALIVHELGHLKHFDPSYQDYLTSFIERKNISTEVLNSYFNAIEKRADLFAFWALKTNESHRKITLLSQIKLWKKFEQCKAQPASYYPSFTARKEWTIKLLKLHKALRLLK